MRGLSYLRPPTNRQRRVEVLLWKLFLALCSLAGLAIICVALFTDHLHSLRGDM